MNWGIWYEDRMNLHIRSENRMNMHIQIRTRSRFVKDATVLNSQYLSILLIKCWHFLRVLIRTAQFILGYRIIMKSVELQIF